MIVGAAIGASASAFHYLSSLYQANGPEHFAVYGWEKGSRAFIIALMGWLFGIVLIGGPIWRLLHKAGKRQWYVALVTGAAIPFFVPLAYQTGFFTGQNFFGSSYYGSGGQQRIDGALTAFGWKMAFLQSFHSAVAGGVIGLTVWLIAYRRANESHVV